MTLSVFRCNKLKIRPRVLLVINLQGFALFVVWAF